MRQHVCSSGYIIESRGPWRFSEVWMSFDLVLLNFDVIPDQLSLCFKKALWALRKRLQIICQLFFSDPKNHQWLWSVSWCWYYCQHCSIQHRNISHDWPRLPWSPSSPSTSSLVKTSPYPVLALVTFIQKSSSCHNPKSVIKCYKWVMILFDIYF